MAAGEEGEEGERVGNENTDADHEDDDDNDGNDHNDGSYDDESVLSQRLRSVECAAVWQTKIPKLSFADLALV